MFATDDTIVAIATPPGRAGLGVIRISGPEARAISSRLLTRRDPLTARHATLSHVRDLTSDEAAGVFAGKAIDARSAEDGLRNAAIIGSDSERSEEARSAELSTIDQVVATLFPSPHSYTGEDVVELAAHGSPILLEGIVASALRAGARLAAPGEFTLRAFLHGRVDLVQAEAVADLIDAVTPAQARQAFDQLDGTLTRAMTKIGESLFDLVVKLEASLDFPDEGYHFILSEEVRSVLAHVSEEVRTLLASARQGRVIREGRKVAIVGGVNVGKSSLFNAFIGADRAIVTEIAGTTRDLLTERCDVGGIPITLIDTAGIRETEEVVEREGVHRARAAAKVADLVLVVLDRSRPLRDEDWKFIGRAFDERLLVFNKVDLPAAWSLDDEVSIYDDGIHAAADYGKGAIGPSVDISVLTGAGMDDLRKQMVAMLTADEPLRDTAGVSNVRHIELLGRVAEALQRARDGAAASVPEEFVLADIREAIEALEEITGKRSSDDVLHAIFSRFCIGK